MNEKLREQIESMFAKAPKTKQTVEIKEEILQNTIDRYNDLISEGKTEQAAFNIAIAGIGDVENLIANLIPDNNFGGYTPAEIQKHKRRSAMILSVAIMLYILCIAPPIIFASTSFADTLGPVLMFVMIAIATGLIIYRSKTALHYTRSDDTVVENFKEWNNKKQETSSVEKAVQSSVWAITVVIYIVLSFLTSAWHITWIIFLIAVAVSNIIKACFDLNR